MSEEKKDETVDEAATPENTDEAAVATDEAQPSEAEAKKGPEPIQIDLDDLGAEGLQRAEESRGRKIPNLDYKVAEEKNLEGSILSLRFEVPREEYAKEQLDLLGDMRKEITLPGFRKGKAPLKLIKLRMGEEGARETVASIGTNVLRQEALKRALKLLSKPQIVAWDVDDAGDGPIGLEIECDLEPTVELKEYKGLTVEVEVHPVTDEMVDKRIQQLREQNATVESAGEGAQVNPGDQIVVDIEVTNEQGEQIGHLCKQNLLVADFQQGQELPKEIADQLVGKKVGESVNATIEATTQTRKGKEVTHTDRHEVTVRDIKIRQLPDLDDDFAKDLGEHETLAQLNDAMRKELDDAEEARQRNEAIGKLVHEIARLNPVDSPRAMIAQQQYNQIMEDSYQLSRMGLQLDSVIQDMGQYLGQQKEQAENTVKHSLLMKEISTVETLEVTDEDVDKAIEEVAQRTSRKALAVRARLEAQKQLDQFRQEVGQRKIGDFLIENNTIEKVPAKPPEEKIDDNQE